ncbi:MAG: hypothetical protein IKA80_05030 [Spirochaetaceae bacterium]|nr:hypothetical protein [Spirochaetaceae bacterium]MBQ7365933.1 hypothetical protein [Spirochaetaceae bacterium]MBR2361993.1 hypothetical protein [Spirochaetaceae bacterium]
MTDGTKHSPCQQGALPAGTESHSFASDTVPCTYRRMTGHFFKVTCVSPE